MFRPISERILADLNKKIVLVSGPRQVGKTTLAKKLVQNAEYFNFDSEQHRLRLREKSWDRSRPLVIFDELHKMAHWKRWLKGIYDTEGVSPRILVTGSARLDVARKVGDSLAGRYFHYRLFPFDLKELRQASWDDQDERAAFNRLLSVGGFPEPYLSTEEDFYPRWKKTHLDIILRQDLIDLESIRSISQIETLITLLRSRVGSPISYSSLARDLERDPATIKHWLSILENMYVIFRVTPYHRNVARSILKEPKLYFYDNGHVLGDKGIQLENLIACALWKELHRLEDAHGVQASLHYLRNKEKKEIDFLTVVNGVPRLMVEVKWSDDSLSSNFDIFAKYLSVESIQKVQLVGEIEHEKTFPSGAEIRRASKWLSRFSIEYK